VRIMALGTALFTATALALSASAQTTPTSSAITRTVVAATKLPSAVETPLYFKAARVTLKPAGRAAYRRPTASSTSSRDRPRSRSEEKTKCLASARDCLWLLARRPR
jgi:hypothetical protein